MRRQVGEHDGDAALGEGLVQEAVGFEGDDLRGEQGAGQATPETKQRN